MTDFVKAMLPRSEMPVEYTWNAESVYASRATWQTESEHIVADFARLAGYAGRLKEGAAILADVIELSSELARRVSTLALYAGFSSAVETTDQEAQSMDARSRGLFGQFLAANSFINPELLAIGKETVLSWIKAEPRINKMEHYVNDLFRLQAHVRSAEVEEVLGMVQEPFAAIETIASLLAGADMKFKDYQTVDGQSATLVQSNFEATKLNPDRTVRETAWNNYADEYLAHKNTLAANLAAAVKANVFMSRVRRYDSALEASLFTQNIPVQVYNNLLETFRRNLPTWHKYWAIRKRALKVDELQPYDIWAPLTDARPKVAYPDAIKFILEGMAPLGEEYVSIMRRGLTEQRWVDVYPNQGKRQGAFSYGIQGTHPFIFQSYTDEIESMSTLAHELGHSMHSYYTNHAQPFMYTGYTMFAAETASNFNQAMVRAHLLQTQTDRDFQIGLIEEAMSNFHRYLFIMPTLARFELEFHTRVEKGHTPGADELITLMSDLFAEGYGGNMHIDHERTGITWATFPHLFSPFYVFNYATGIAAANALAKQILEQGESAAAPYREFLKTGGSMYPVDELKLAGADMMTPDPVDKAFQILAGMVDRLDELTR